MTQEKGNASQEAKKGPNLPTQKPLGWQQKLETLRLKFDRFGWDVLGVLFIALALITILGLTGLTEGGILRIWINFILRWFGWGSYLLVVFFVFLGVFTFLNRNLDKPVFPFWKVVAFELFGFTLFALLSVLKGHSLDRAESGLDGGLIGWGLAELLRLIFPISWVGLLCGILAFLFFGYIAGLFKWITGFIASWAERVRAEPMVDVSQIIDEYGNTNRIGNGFKRFAREKGASDVGNQVNTMQVTPTRRRDFLPPLNLLQSEILSKISEDNVHQTAKLIEQTLDEFSIPARVVGFRVGPTVTQFAVEPGYVERQSVNGEISKHKVRVSQISALSRDLALALSAERLRIEAPVPGQSFVGIEVPNPKSSNVGLRSILESEEFHKVNSPLCIALGKDVSGRPVVADLARMPHLLIAGTTGSGKSVCIAAITMCLIMNNSPEQLNLVMLDPKMVELVRFNGLKHLLGKVETETERILVVLKWAMAEMDRRYRLLEKARAKNIDAYNQLTGRKQGEYLPKIVILIDELADLMLSAPDQTEHSLVRLAQMARATGIHLVLATQRPSTDVVTGLIKANFSARISFNVASSIDSRVILDESGAENLLGKGDMLFLNPELGKPTRTQGVIVEDGEIERVIQFWQDYEADEAKPVPWEELIQETQEKDQGPDRLLQEAVEIVKETQRASASMLQRRLRIGYPRAARLIDELEEIGVVGPSQGGGRERDVLIDQEDNFADNEEDDFDQDKYPET